MVLLFCGFYFQAIGEAEEEWSQQNAMKLIETGNKGLLRSVPKDFPYFHVEFGLKKGFVHVIDGESRWKSNFDVDIIRGMFGLPEDRHSCHKHDSIATTKEVANFALEWVPFDWTNQFHQ